MPKPRILVVEDDPIIAIDICETLESVGVEVVGPAYDLSSGLKLARCEHLDFALLDLNLRDQVSTPIARHLHDEGTAFAFLSATPRADLPDFAGSTAIAKPFDPRTLVGVVSRNCPELQAA